MTLRAALDRLGRGFRRMGVWVVARIRRARGYRYDGEQAAHAEQLQETQVALSLMATASDDPEQIRMASDIEHGAENRLTVLLGKARLTLEEKRERDAIQAALAARRQGFDRAPAKVSRFAALGANPIAALAMNPLTWAMVGVVGLGGMNAVTGWRLDHAKRDLSETRHDLQEAVADRDGWKKAYEEAHGAVIDAAEQAATTAQTLARLERQRRAAQAAQQRTQRDVANVLSGVGDPPDFGLRNDEHVSPRPAPADPGAEGGPG